MNFTEIYETYLKLQEILKQKKEAIVKKDIETLNQIDENLMVVIEKIQKFDIKNIGESFSDKEKEDLKLLGKEIKKLEEDIEILINHSLNVINNTLSGILNITQKDKNTYNSYGKNCIDDESLNISSIVQDA